MSLVNIHIIAEGEIPGGAQDESGVYHLLAKELSKVAESFGLSLWIDEVLE